MKNNGSKALRKCPTGIGGLDEITGGGLPRGRPTLVCGGPGCGKTLLGMEFLVRGIRDFGEPGVIMTFEETAEELAKNVFSLGFDLPGLMRRKKLAVDHVYLERREFEETGEYDLEGLFVRLGTMIGEVKARRVVIDSVEALFAGLPNEGILRAELRRLFRWLKQKGVTAIITAEKGGETLTRHGLEEYISDCVIFLDHRVINQIATRRLRIVKYRGSSHGTNEFPTMIDKNGLSVLPVSSLTLDYPVSTVRVPSGIKRLDAMLGGQGYYKGSSILISGTAGTGKTSIAAAFAASVCARGEKCLYFSFEESPGQIIRNMASIGIDLSKWVRNGLLSFCSLRSSQTGLEQHLARTHELVGRLRPSAVIMDPITNFITVGNLDDIKAMLTRIIDYLKNLHITALFTSLTGGGSALEESEVGISSLMDTWLLLQQVQSASERNRVLYVLKSRGMAHSNQMREFVLSDEGIELVDVYTGPGRVYTGTARITQEARDRAESFTSVQATQRRQRELEQERLGLEVQLRALRGRIEGIREEMKASELQEKLRLQESASERKELMRRRKAD